MDTIHTSGHAPLPGQSFYVCACGKCATCHPDHEIMDDCPDTPKQPVVLTSCLVKSVDHNGDGTSRIVVDRRLVGSDTSVPFEFNHPSDKCTRLLIGHTVRLDLDKLAGVTPVPVSELTPSERLDKIDRIIEEGGKP